jgi:uncharacterized membrane protein
MGIFEWRPFNGAEEQQLKEAIAQAEKGTSGEVRLHIDRYCKTDPLFKAGNIFKHLGMEETEGRSGVLIYIAMEERKLAIIGDTGINEKVGAQFWEAEKELLIRYFKSNQMLKGLVLVIAQIGDKLREHFPQAKGNTNELSNEISFGQGD